MAKILNANKNVLSLFWLLITRVVKFDDFDMERYRSMDRIVNKHREKITGKDGKTVHPMHAKTKEWELNFGEEDVIFRIEHEDADAKLLEDAWKKFDPNMLRSGDTPEEADAHVRTVLSADDALKRMMSPPALPEPKE